MTSQSRARMWRQRRVPSFAKDNEQDPRRLEMSGGGIGGKLELEAGQVGTKAIDSQVGGDHYKGQPLQPIEATYLRYGYFGVKAALHTKVDKYLTRDKDDELEQLKKAKHCLELMIEFREREDEVEKDRGRDEVDVSGNSNLVNRFVDGGLGRS